MAGWAVLVLGVALFLAGIVGQFFGLGKARRPMRPEDRRTGMLVLRIGSVIVGLWLVFISAAHVTHMSFTGH